MYMLAASPGLLDPMTISVVAFIGVFGAIASVVVMMQADGNKDLENRLDILAGKKKVKADGTTVSSETLMKEGMEGISGIASQFMQRFGNIRLLFVQADTNIKPEMFLAIVLGSGAAGLGAAILGRMPVPSLPLIFAACCLMPFGWLMFKRGRRFKRFGKQLPDAMELIARALRSGHSLSAAMKVVVDELPDPISKEFNIAYEEQNLGVPIEDALKHLYLRMPNMDYKFFSMAVAIQRQSGGDLAEILDKIGKIIRDRFRILGQVQALTGEGRISGIVLMALPIALFFAVWRLNEEYVMLLFTDELGRKMVAVAVVLQIMGAICIKKIISIKV